MGRRQNELRTAAGLIFKLRVIVAVQDLKISFYKQILLPLLLASATSLRLLWRRHWLVARIKVLVNFGVTFTIE